MLDLPCPGEEHSFMQDNKSHNERPLIKPGDLIRNGSSKSKEA